MGAKKILIVTDSLGLPRIEPETVSFQDTYITLLRNKYPEFEIISISIGGATINTLLGQMFYYKGFDPDFVFIQSGIVDCAPRALTKTETTLLGSNKYIKRFSKKMLKPLLPILRKYRNKTDTTLKEFIRCLTAFKDLFPKSNLYWFQIIPALEGYENLVPGITNNINLFNDAIFEIVRGNTLNTSTFELDDIMTDFHHLSKLGHYKVFKMIDNVINCNE